MRKKKVGNENIIDREKVKPRVVGGRNCGVSDGELNHAQNGCDVLMMHGH